MHGDAPAASSEVPTHTGFRTLFRNLAGDFRALPSRENLGWTVFGTVVALSVHPFDSTVNQHLLGRQAARNFFVTGKTIGNGYVQVAGAIGSYAVGRLSHKPRVTHVGMDLLESQLMAGAITYALKVTVRRERPDGSNNKSFPSGHASLTFATATVLQRHLGWKWSMPVFFIASYSCGLPPARERALPQRRRGGGHVRGDFGPDRDAARPIGVHAAAGLDAWGGRALGAARVLT